MPLFEYEPLVLSLEAETSNEGEIEGIQMGQDHKYKSSKITRRPQRRKG